MIQDIEQKRNLVREVVKDGLLEIIEISLSLYDVTAAYEYCKNQWSGGDYAVDILDSWLDDEDGKLAIDRLVTLIIH